MIVNRDQKIHEQNKMFISAIPMQIEHLGNVIEKLNENGIKYQHDPLLADRLQHVFVNLDALCSLMSQTLIEVERRDGLS